MAGYTGDVCEIGDLASRKVLCMESNSILLDIDECDSVPCHNGGNCTDGIDGFTCGCVPGHTGVLCETGRPSLCFSMLYNQSEIYCGSDIGECTSAPCQNNGTCVDEINRFTCNCSFGFTGDHCETSNRCVFNNELFVETLLSIEILMNVHLRLAKTAELASMELTCTRVCA